MTNKRIGPRQALQAANFERTQNSAGDDSLNPNVAEERLRESRETRDEPSNGDNDAVTNDALRRTDPYHADDDAS